MEGWIGGLDRQQMMKGKEEQLTKENKENPKNMQEKKKKKP